jgi:5-methylcytosine-specific restriction endonuclease McrA
MPHATICRHGLRPAGTTCPHCAAADNKRRARKAEANGLTTSRWRKLRATALRRDSHRCQLELPGCTHRATTVHLDPRLNGDHTKATLADVLSACHHCHGRVDAPRAAPRGPVGEPDALPRASSRRARTVSL